MDINLNKGGPNQIPKKWIEGFFLVDKVVESAMVFG